MSIEEKRWMIKLITEGNKTYQETQNDLLCVFMCEYKNKNQNGKNVTKQERKPAQSN